jgi:uncharacterized protein with GYD domain
MAYYLLQFAYTPQAWAALTRNPQNRLEAVRPVAERLGGRLVNKWFSFGDYDVVAILEIPDNVSAAAFSMAIASGGAVRSFKTTPLMTMDEGIEAMRRAPGLNYRSPLS